MQTVADLFEIQGHDATVTPTELIDIVRGAGRSVSRRKLSFWSEQDLMPAALRVGARGGVYPAVVVDLVLMALDMQERGVSLDAVRELLPLWQHLVASQHNGQLVVADVEEKARGLALSREANVHVPYLVEHVSQTLCTECKSSVNWILKDGTIVPAVDRVEIKFAIAEIDHRDGLADIVAWTQLVLPGINELPTPTDPALVILGIPNGASVRQLRCDHQSPEGTRASLRRVCRTRPRSRKKTEPQTEVLPLSQ